MPKHKRSTADSGHKKHEQAFQPERLRWGTMDGAAEADQFPTCDRNSEEYLGNVREIDMREVPGGRAKYNVNDKLDR